MASTSTHNPKVSLARLRKQYADAKLMIGGHEELLAVAKRLGMEAEIEHQRSSAAEWEHELDFVMELAISAGYGPEDFDGA